MSVLFTSRLRCYMDEVTWSQNMEGKNNSVNFLEFRAAESNVRSFVVWEGTIRGRV